MPQLGGRGGIGAAGPVEVDFHATHRHFDISLPTLNITIVHRFNGEFGCLHTAGMCTPSEVCYRSKAMHSNLQPHHTQATTTSPKLAEALRPCATWLCSQWYSACWVSLPAQTHRLAVPAARPKTATR